MTNCCFSCSISNTGQLEFIFTLFVNVVLSVNVSLTILIENVFTRKLEPKISMSVMTDVTVRKNYQNIVFF